LMLALFGAAGSVGWERARSLVLALIAGVSRAVLGILIALIAAFLLNLFPLLQEGDLWQLSQPFDAAT